MKIRVVIADDHQIFRDGLITLLEGEDDIEIIGTAKNGIEAVNLARSLYPDLIIMDITMPEMDGIEATSRLKTEKPGIKIVALSMHSDRQFVKRMLKAGIDAYLLKSCSSKKLIDVIHSVYKNKKILSEDITDMVISDYLKAEAKVL